MFRSTIAITLLIALLVSNCSRLLIYGYFELNKDYIIASLCENRTKPEMNCLGRCVLAKKLKQAEEKEKRQEQEAHKKGFQENFILKIYEMPPMFSLDIKESQPAFKVSDLPEVSFDILHPPPAYS